jgi:hypothetical protein
MTWHYLIAYTASDIRSRLLDRCSHGIVAPDFTEIVLHIFDEIVPRVARLSIIDLILVLIEVRADPCCSSRHDRVRLRRYSDNSIAKFLRNARSLLIGTRDERSRL